MKSDNLSTEAFFMMYFLCILFPLHIKNIIPNVSNLESGNLKVLHGKLTYFVTNICDKCSFLRTVEHVDFFPPSESTLTFLSRSEQQSVTFCNGSSVDCSFQWSNLCEMAREKLFQWESSCGILPDYPMKRQDLVS